MADPKTAQQQYTPVTTYQLLRNTVAPAAPQVTGKTGIEYMYTQSVARRRRSRSR